MLRLAARCKALPSLTDDLGSRGGPDERNVRGNRRGSIRRADGVDQPPWWR